MRLLLAFALIAASALAQAEIKTQEVRYQDRDGTAMIGYHAYDDSFTGPRPGVLVVHEWWGLNDYVIRRTRELAALGYSAMAIDMYGHGKNTEHPKDAMAFMQAATRDTATTAERFDAGLAALKLLPPTNPNKIAAIGYCFGGKVVLDAARRGEPLVGVVSFHGPLATTTPATHDRVVAKILVEHGASDSMVTPQSVENFKQEMAAANVGYEFVSIEGAKHGFSNPDSDRLSHGEHGGPDIGYNESADKSSWADMQAFLVKVFK